MYDADGIVKVNFRYCVSNFDIKNVHFNVESPHPRNFSSTYRLTLVTAMIIKRLIVQSVIIFIFTENNE
jgi:hypothetical protein